MQARERRPMVSRWRAPKRRARHASATLRGEVTWILHAATPFGPKACTFRAYFPENARICVHGGRKKGRFCGVNRRPFLRSQLPSLGRRAPSEGPDERGAGATHAGGNGQEAADARNAE